MAERFKPRKYTEEQFDADLAVLKEHGLWLGELPIPYSLQSRVKRQPSRGREDSSSVANPNVSAQAESTPHSLRQLPPQSRLRRRG